jgi:hypothetical protein
MRAVLAHAVGPSAVTAGRKTESRETAHGKDGRDENRGKF